MTPAEKFIHLLTNIVRKELKTMTVPYCPAKARVTRSYIEQSIYYCDVLILNADGSYNEDFPSIKVEAGNLIQIGTIVRIGFYYNNESMPFIDAVFGGVG